MITRGRIRNVILGATAAAAGAILIAISQPPTNPIGTCTSVSQYGMTFSFNKAVPCGQFVNGDNWVTPAAGDSAVTITAISPAFTGTSNGWEVNPSASSDASTQGWDSRVSTFDAALVPSLPYAAAPNSSIIKAVSNPGTCTVSPANDPCLSDTSILTVLGSTPPNNGATVFRPPWAGGTKTLYSTVGMQTNLLPSLSLASGAPSLSSLEARMQRPQLMPFNNFLDRFLHPANAFYQIGTPSNNHDYGAELSSDFNDALLVLEGNATLAQKTNLINYMVQAGIDLYGWRLLHSYTADGGHYVGRKIVEAFAALMLNNSSMKTVAADTGWDENQHFYFSSSAGVSGRKYFNDDPATGMMLWGKTCSGSTYQNNLNNVNTGAKDCQDNLSFQIDGGNPPNDQYAWCCTMGNYWAESTILRNFPQLDAVYSLPRLHNYVDRQVDFGAWTQPDTATRNCNGTPCGFGSQNGTKTSITNGTNAFQQAMWTLHQPLDTFCGVGGCTGTTGASLATCSGGTCTNGTNPTTSVNHVGSLNGNSTWEFSYYIPNGLTGTAPFVLIAGGGSNCGSIPNQNYAAGWQGVANTHRYGLISVVCPGGSSWNAEEDDGTSGSPSSDTAYVAAVVNYLSTHTLLGVTPDMSRLYFTGGSSGGHMTRAVMCSQATVSLFRAVAIVAAGANAVSGTAPFSGTPNGKCFYTADKTIFALYMAGNAGQDPIQDYCGGGAGTLCTAGQTLQIFGRANTLTYETNYFGCSSPSSNTVTVASSSVVTTTFGNCSAWSGAVSSQLVTITVTPGQHSYGGIDNSTTPGYAADQAATFFDGTTN